MDHRAEFFREMAKRCGVEDQWATYVVHFRVSKDGALLVGESQLRSGQSTFDIVDYFANDAAAKIKAAGPFTPPTDEQK